MGAVDCINVISFAKVVNVPTHVHSSAQFVVVISGAVDLRVVAFGLH